MSSIQQAFERGYAAGGANTYTPGTGEHHAFEQGRLTKMSDSSSSLAVGASAALGQAASFSAERSVGAAPIVLDALAGAWQSAAWVKAGDSEASNQCTIIEGRVGAWEACIEVDEPFCRISFVTTKGNVLYLPAVRTFESLRPRLAGAKRLVIARTVSAPGLMRLMRGIARFADSTARQGARQGRSPDTTAMNLAGRVAFYDQYLTDQQGQIVEAVLVGVVDDQGLHTVLHDWAVWNGKSRRAIWLAYGFGTFCLLLSFLVFPLLLAVACFGLGWVQSNLCKLNDLRATHWRGFLAQLR